MCKKTYPKLINITQNKEVLLLTGIINTHGHYAHKRKNLRNTTSHPCRYGSFILRHD